jgi:hypothetical protein
VDAIAEITSYAEYAAFGDRLRALGFQEDTREGAPLCRWVHHGTTLDVMPLDQKILGFSNRWYRAAMESSVTVRLWDDLEIRIVTSPFFIATKLEAFKGRGKGDFFGSHDLEDLISVVDGRPALVTEVQAGAVDLRAYVRAEIHGLLSTPGFLDALPGYLLPDAISQSRIPSFFGAWRTLRRFSMRGLSAFVVNRRQPASTLFPVPFRVSPRPCNLRVYPLRSEQVGIL